MRVVRLVRKGGFEPPRLSAPPPQDGVSASSTTSALKTPAFHPIQRLADRLRPRCIYRIVVLMRSCPAMCHSLKRPSIAGLVKNIWRRVFKSGIRIDLNLITQPAHLGFKTQGNGWVEKAQISVPHSSADLLLFGSAEECRRRKRHNHTGSQHPGSQYTAARSEERRVGKQWRS